MLLNPESPGMGLKTQWPGPHSGLKIQNLLETKLSGTLCNQGNETVPCFPNIFRKLLRNVI